jgi:8-oxo-dGTP diphosphatase
VKLFGAYGKPERDPRKHVISVFYEVEVDGDISGLKGCDDAVDASFFDVKELVDKPDKFAFDHYTVMLDYLKSINYLL